MKKRDVAIALVLSVLLSFIVGYSIFYLMEADEIAFLKEHSYDNQGFDYIVEGNYEEALMTFNLYLEKDESNYHALAGIGWANLLLGNSVAAENNFRQSLSFDDDQVSAHHGVAQSLLAQGKYTEAISKFDIVNEMDMDPKTIANLQNGMGYAYQKLGRHYEAITAFRNAIALSPDHLLAHIGLLVSADAIKESERAEESYTFIETTLTQTELHNHYESAKFVACIHENELIKEHVIRCGSQLYESG